MTCGMDYKYLVIPEFEPNYPLLFYDVWVARSMEGLPFYDIIYPSGEWELPARPLASSASREDFDSLLPFQVYSCFNGITVIAASFFAEGIEFRSEAESDIQSECFLLCRDIWRLFSPYSWNENGNLIAGKGTGARIMISPRVAVGYDLEEYEAARQDRNMTAFEQEDRVEPSLIDWKVYPPKLVASYPFGEYSCSFENFETDFCFLGRWNEVVSNVMNHENYSELTRCFCRSGSLHFKNWLSHLAFKILLLFIVVHFRAIQRELNPLTSHSAGNIERLVETEEIIFTGKPQKSLSSGSNHLLCLLTDFTFFCAPNRNI